MKRICLFLTVITLISFSCGGKDKVRPSADSLMTQEALRVIKVIKEAYEEKDRGTLKNNLSSMLMEDIVKELFFEKATLSLTPRLVRISASNIMVHMNWQGTWTVKDRTFKNRGVATLVFQKEKVKLIQIEGDNPFHIPVIR
jgi:hypothetical protein